MSKYVKPEIKEGELGINQFLANLKIPVSKVAMAGQWSTDKDGIVLPVEIEIEKDSSCRVYVDAERRKHMVGLSPRSKDLLLWLIYEVENGKDWMWINYVRYMEECNINSYNTYKNAVTELIKKSFIQKTVVQHVYWINPNFFFNGSRINRFPKNIIKK